MAALGMEYSWKPDSKFAGAALADKYMRFNFDLKVLDGGWKPLSRAGSRDQWENKWTVKTEGSAAEILDGVNKAIDSNKVYGNASENSKWVRSEVQASKTANQSWWRFTDENGGAWNGVVSVEPRSGEEDKISLKVKIGGYRSQ